MSIELPDLPDLTMDDLDRLPDTVLGDMLRRVIDEVVNPSGEPVAAFDSSI